MSLRFVLAGWVTLVLVTGSVARAQGTDDEAGSGLAPPTVGHRPPSPDEVDPEFEDPVETDRDQVGQVEPTEREPPPAPEAGSESESESTAQPPPDLDAPEESEEEESEEEDWLGPRMELAYAHYRLRDGHGGGGVHAFQFGGYAPLRRFLLGGQAEVGVRDYALGQNDLLVRASLIAGYQHVPGFVENRIVPYGGITGHVGVLFGKRFHTPVSHIMRGAGFELGAHFRLVKSLWAGLGFGYVRTRFQDFGYNLFLVRLRLGL